MTRPAPLSGLRAIVCYTLFDLRTVAGYRAYWVGQVVAPMFLAVPLLGLWWFATSADSWGTGWVETLYSPPAVDVTWRIEDAEGNARASTVIGERGGLQAPPVEAPVEPEATTSPSQAAQLALGFWVLGLFGVGTSLTVGTRLAATIRTGFNQVLSLGTSGRDIYVSELITLALVQLQQSSLWWSMSAAVMYALGLLPAGGTTEGIALVRSLPLCLGLAVLTTAQGTALGLIGARVAEDLPQSVRQGVPAVLGIAIWVGLGQVSSISVPALGWLALAPVVGPLATWAHLVYGGPSSLAGVAAQLVWAALALRIGAWVFLLDESPQRVLWRRWRKG